MSPMAVATGVAASIFPPDARQAPAPLALLHAPSQIDDLLPFETLLAPRASRTNARALRPLGTRLPQECLGGLVAL